MQTVLEKMRQETTERNAAYALMSSTERRVAIAKDCLALLNAQILNASCGTYVQINADTVSNFEPLSLGEGSIQEALFEAGVTKCDCCAKGALFMSKVLGYNNVDFDDTEHDFNDDDDYNGDGIGFSDPTYNLDDAFDDRTLINIEYAFECRQICFGGDYRAIFMYWDVEDEEDRLRLICKNLIDNNGDFVIELSHDNEKVYQQNLIGGTWYRPI